MDGVTAIHLFLRCGGANSQLSTPNVLAAISRPGRNIDTLSTQLSFTITSNSLHDQYFPDEKWSFLVTFTENDFYSSIQKFIMRPPVVNQSPIVNG